jgi:hypothetical protein
VAVVRERRVQDAVPNRIPERHPHAWTVPDAVPIRGVDHGDGEPDEADRRAEDQDGVP